MPRYSNRLRWTASQNQFSILLSELRATGRTLLDLSISNPTEALAEYPHAEIAAAFNSISDFRYQPEPFGLFETRTAIVHRLRQRVPRVDLSQEHVALTASTSEAYSHLFKLLADPGDEILVPTPSYPLFDYLAQLEAIKLRPYRLSYDGSWSIDFASLEAALSNRSRAVILVNPNNPTGSFLKASEFEQLRRLALAHTLPLISDEVFTDFAFAESIQRMTTLAAQDDVLTFTLNGLSKASAMPQMKLAWIIVSGPAKERNEACSRLELVLDTYLSVGTPVQLAAPKLFSIGDRLQQRIRRRVQNNLSNLAALLANQSIHMLHSEGGWSAILRVPQMLSEELWIMRLLREYGVIVQPGYFFDMPGEAFLVVSLLTAEETFSAGIGRILALARQL